MKTFVKRRASDSRNVAADFRLMWPARLTADAYGVAVMFGVPTMQTPLGSMTAARLST